ncbi:MAG: YggS family pyridoxal phosphate enzyme [Spirochaetaceae bacterium 4572_7]|nr:MAG: YggS family pyridoxal phosphate enzyme [Spirochaetaceae bacterium 4572_7]
MSIEENLSLVKDNILELERLNNRSPHSVELLAVSKRKPLEDLQRAYDCGQRIFGENRVSEAEIKVPGLPSDAIFHMIGHLQSNKVKKACSLFNTIQSVDSIKILQKIDRECKLLGKVMNIYLDINISGEDSKTGFSVDSDFPAIIDIISNSENLNLVGLMGMGSNVNNDVEIKNSFLRLVNLRDELEKISKGKLKLSMGMSGDYHLAIEMGSDMVRVGSKIFGIREL